MLKLGLRLQFMSELPLKSSTNRALPQAVSVKAVIFLVKYFNSKRISVLQNTSRPVMLINMLQIASKVPLTNSSTTICHLSFIPHRHSLIPICFAVIPQSNFFLCQIYYRVGQVLKGGPPTFFQFKQIKWFAVCTFLNAFNSYSVCLSTSYTIR